MIVLILCYKTEIVPNKTDIPRTILLMDICRQF